MNKDPTCTEDSVEVGAKWDSLLLLVCIWTQLRRMEEERTDPFVLKPVRPDRMSVLGF